jgi:hypothetical protein
MPTSLGSTHVSPAHTTRPHHHQTAGCTPPSPLSCGHPPQGEQAPTPTSLTLCAAAPTQRFWCEEHSCGPSPYHTTPSTPPRTPQPPRPHLSSPLPLTSCAAAAVQRLCDPGSTHAGPAHTTSHSQKCEAAAHANPHAAAMASTQREVGQAAPRLRQLPT